MAGQGGKTEYSSLDSISEICKILGSQGTDVVEIITKNVLKKKKLQPFVDQYLKSTDKTLNFFNTVEKCVEKAKKIQVAIQQLEIESLAGPALSPNGPNMRLQSCRICALIAVVRLRKHVHQLLCSNLGYYKTPANFYLYQKNKYAETLEKLKKVKAMEDPFGDEFETHYESVCEEQVMLLVKIGEVQVMLEKKLKNTKIWMGLGIGFLISINIARIFLAALGLHGVHTLGADMMHPHAHAHADALSHVSNLLSNVFELTKKLTGMLEDYEKSLKTRRDLSQLTGNSTKGNIKEIKTIKDLVDPLITRMSTILDTEEVAIEKREEESVKFLMQEIIQKVNGFAEKIEEVGANVAKSSKSVASERDCVLKHIAN